MAFLRHAARFAVPAFLRRRHLRTARDPRLSAGRRPHLAGVVRGAEAWAERAVGSVHGACGARSRRCARHHTPQWLCPPGNHAFERLGLYKEIWRQVQGEARRPRACGLCLGAELVALPRAPPAHAVQPAGGPSGPQPASGGCLVRWRRAHPYVRRRAASRMEASHDAVGLEPLGGGESRCLASAHIVARARRQCADDVARHDCSKAEGPVVNGESTVCLRRVGGPP
mmetsp:Transcript_42439/g.123328  ORF Transcript_42439/g.123328 Transcript_42439/m.123328 type:complete len:227 (-) Transcript_42439:66-746(-)